MPSRPGAGGSSPSSAAPSATSRRASGRAFLADVACGHARRRLVAPRNRPREGPGTARRRVRRRRRRHRGVQPSTCSRCSTVSSTPTSTLERLRARRRLGRRERVDRDAAALAGHASGAHRRTRPHHRVRRRRGPAHRDQREVPPRAASAPSCERAGLAPRRMVDRPSRRLRAVAGARDDARLPQPCARRRKRLAAPLSRRGPDRPVDARREPDEVAPGPHDVVLRDVRPRAARAGYRRYDPRVRLPVQLVLRGRRPAALPRRTRAHHAPGRRRDRAPTASTSTTAVQRLLVGRPSTAHVRARRARAAPRAAAPGAAPDGHQARARRATRCARPTASCRSGGRQRSPAAPARWVEHGGGIVEIGHGEGGFAFDNEGPRHEVLLRPFEIAAGS